MDSNPIYKFMKDNGLTQKDEATFVSEYSNPQKSAELHKFMVDNKLTTKSSDDFYNEYFAGSKKKEPTTQDSNEPVQQPGKPSAPSFGQKVVGEAITQEVQIPLRGQQKAPVQKKPYQDITYKREQLPSETTQMPETPVVKAAKKDFKQSQIKPQVQLKSTPEELEAIEKRTESADKKGLVLNEYQSSADTFNELNLLKKEDANDFYRNLKDARPDLYEKYSGRTIEEGRSLEGDMRQSQEDRDLVYKNYLSDLQRADENHRYSINKVTPIIDSIVDEKVTPESYGKFTTGHSIELGGDVVDMGKVDDEAMAIAEKYNLPTDGDSWRLLKNKIKSNTDFQIIKPQAEEIFKSKYPELQAKRQKMFEDGFKYDDEIYSRVESELTSLQDQYAADAKNEFNAIDAEYKSKSELLNQQYKQFTDQATQVESNLNDLYKTGQIDQLTYETRWSDLQKEKKDYFEAYKKDFPSLDEYVKKSNEINSKYNRKFELQKKALTDKAQTQISKEFDNYASAYKEDPAVLDELNKAYRESFELASDIRTKKMGLGAELSNVPLMKHYQSTLASLGGVFKGWAGSLDSKTLELLGESMEQNFMMPAARTEEFKDWLDPQNLQLLTGQLLGSMAPSMAITAAVATATGGSGVPAIVPMVAGGLAGWSSETVDIVGRSYLDMFEKSGGNVADANKAAERSLKSQYDLMFTYAFDALPFVGKVLGGIPTKMGRVAAGAGIEMGTEFLQEYPQNIAEENIQKGLDPWTNLGEALQDTKKMKQTLISIGPVAILGGAGQLGSKSARQEAVDTYVSMQQKAALSAALPDQKRQYVQNMVFDRGGKFAKGVVGAMFADGTIDEETSKDLLVQVERSEKIQEAGKSAGLKGSKLNIYGFYSARAEEAERNAAKFGNDPILSESYKQQAKQYRDAGLDFMKGNNPDLLTVTYADGSQAMMTPEDVNGLFSNPIALTLLNKKKISVESYREKGEGAKAIQELSERAEAYKQTKRYTAPAKRGTSLEYWQGLANRRMEQLKTQQPELSEDERLAAIKKIEDEVNTSFQAQIDQEKQRKLMELEQKELTEKQRKEEIKRIEEEETAAFKIKVQEFEQKKRDQRDIDIEQMQQQRESLGVSEVNAFFSDMKPLVGTTVERMEQGKPAPQSAVKVASDYLYAKYKELTAMKADPNRMMTIAQIESVQAQIEQDLETLAGNPPSQKTEARDQENIQGVSGEVGVGQEPVQAEPVEVPSTEAPEAGGVLQAPEEEVTPTTEAAPKAAPAPKPSLGQRLRTAAEAAETTVSVQEPAPVKEEKKEGVAPAPKKEKKPTETKAKAPEIAPTPRRADAVEASEGSNENAGVESALDGVEMDETSLNEWKKANKAPSKKGRIEELTQLVRDLMSGKIKFKDYYEKAKQLMPSKLMDKVPAITSFKEIVGSIDKNKLGIGIINLNKFVKKGMKVGLRIDIPAFNNFGKNVVTVHDRTGSGQPVIGYGSTGSISNVTFRTSVSTAVKIGTGESKSAFAMAEGEWLDESPESIQARAEEALNSPEWIQVSMNPTRSSFFYDKADGNPVISADEVLQVGNLVLAKNAQKIDLNTKEGMTQFEKMFSAKTKEGVTYQYRRGTSLGQRLRATFDTAGERAAEDIARFLEESGIDVQVIDSVEAERLGQERNIEGSIDGIFFADKDSGIIYLNKDSLKGKDGATIAYHEGIHPVINIIRNTNPELYGAIVAGIREEAKRNPAVARVIRQIESVKEYQKRGPEAIEDEIVVETLAQIASGGINLNELDKTLKQKMIEFFNKLVERMPKLAAAFNLKPIKVDATSQELLAFSKKLSTALTEGGKISDVVGAENVMSYENNLAQESGTIETGSVVYAGQATIRAKKGTKVKNPYRTSVNLPARTLESLLEEYGDNVIVVNSDPTGLGTVRLPSGKVIQVDGGIGYMAIQENIDAGVGFASSSDARVNFLYKTANQMNEDGKLKNGKVLVLVMVQKADSMLGNNYTPDYVADALAKIPQDAISKEKLTNLLVEPLKKETFKSFFYKESKIPKMKPYKNKDKKTPAENEKLKEDHIKKYNAEVAKINESNAKKKADGLAKVDAIEAEIRAIDPRTAHDDMVRVFHELSFVQAQKYFDNILGKYTNKTTKYNLEISRLLYQYAGADQRNLFQVLGEKSLVDQLLKDPKSWGYAVAAFVHDTAKQKGKLGGIKHNLFNAKFQGDERYILTEAYKVNDIMTEFNAEQVRKVEEEGKKGAVFAEQQASQGMYPSGKAVIPAKKGVEFGSLQKTSNRFQASLIDRSKEGGLRPSSEGLKIVNGWYSPIEKRLRETKADKQSAQKWLTSGIIGKGDEAIYTGVKGWLESKKPTDQVSKQEIIDWMDNNRVEIQEISKSDEPKMSDTEARDVFENQGYDVVTDSNGDTYVEKDEELYDYEDMSPLERDAFDVLSRSNLDAPKKTETKYQTYQLEGEKKNYKELLVTLPKNTLPEGYKVVPKSQYKGATSNFIVIDPDGYSIIGGDTEDEAIAIFMRFRREGGGFQSSHFEEPNILVHLRMNTRTDANGNKVLFLEEIQSDWGQKGKKEGFKPLGEFNESKISTKTKPNDKLEVYYNNELVDELFTGYSTSEEIKKDVLNAAKSYFDYSLSLKTTPSAPFVTDTNAWTKLGLKMALREAVKQGVDRVAWTTGEQQNQRYDLSKQVDSINYLKNGDGTYQVYAKKNGDIIFKERALEENKLEGAFGKDVAERIINDRGKSEEGLATKVLSGSDLSVGGKGMKGFYDNIVPNVAQALVKELTGETGAIGTIVLGEKIGLTKNAVIEENRNGLFNIYDREKSPVPIFKNIETREQAEEILNNPVKNASTQQSIDITPELKAAVQGGMPQFSLIDRSGNDIGPLIEEAADAVEQAIASGTAPQQALDEFIGSQEWYSDLTPGQRKQIDDILQEEFGTTPKVSVKKPTGIKGTIANLIDNYYKLKDKDTSARGAIDQILDADPKLNYIYKNIRDINKQLQAAGVITEKTDGCP